jgi:hypothetical protein
MEVEGRTNVQSDGGNGHVDTEGLERDEVPAAADEDAIYLRG